MMWCAFCGRCEEDCPGGIWRGSRKGAEGVCLYCARSAMRALDPTEPPAVRQFVERPIGRAPDPPEAA